ncbi:uncharacterized protein LTR77_007609 [Saxophila tyrrhenica]|uniref:Uncharacterized protein n=1 Tax=Saxophila tyrrhenica TaxID=1690608 RepID=A0AAV9P6C5_9PEZI|nr:hypothetical protein LTR77_007609 [Saxophila tyrrhenica]
MSSFCDIRSVCKGARAVDGNSKPSDSGKDNTGLKHASTTRHGDYFGLRPMRVKEEDYQSPVPEYEVLSICRMKDEGSLELRRLTIIVNWVEEHAGSIHHPGLHVIAKVNEKGFDTMQKEIRRYEETL